MTFDAGETTHAMKLSIPGAEETLIGSDATTSQKPWLLLRMLEGLSGEDLFRDGVRAYLAATTRLRYRERTTLGIARTRDWQTD